MKKLGFYVLAGMMFLMSGCLDDDGYSLSKVWIGFGIVQETEDESVRIILDDGEVLIPIASNHYHNWNENRHDDHGKPIANGDRLRLNFTILGEDVDTDGNVVAYYVKLNSTKKVLMKGILDITPENADSIGNDPVLVKDVWMTDSLLNFKIKYWGDKEIHFINLVKQPGEVTEMDQPIVLELRHNANGDSEYIPYAAYVSFKLSELQIEGQNSVQFVVNAMDYDEELFEYEGTYVYN